MARDLTEQKKAEAERADLESRNRQLQKAESLGRTAGAIAHHFNNQLQSVLGNLELASQAPSEADPSRWLAGARRAAERAAEVSRLMLAYLGQASPEREPHSLSELCRDSFRLIQDTLPAALAVDCVFPVPGPTVNVDASQLRQVLSNLVANAQEAMGGVPGRVRLEITTCEAAAIPRTHRFPVNWQPRESDYACLKVADDGSGIPGADIEKLFDPFFSTKFIGRGLGLSVALGIVQAHGGVVTVESEPDKGSRFKVHLPMHAQAVPIHPRGKTAAPMMAAGGTVLLADDDQDLLETTGAVLEMMGFQVLTTRNGAEALEVFREHRSRIRCVITDLTMPRMDGWETLTALQQLDPTLPVILASGYDKAHVMSGSHPVHPRAFLGKPFTLSTLHEALDQSTRWPGP